MNPKIWIEEMVYLLLSFFFFNRSNAMVLIDVIFHPKPLSKMSNFKERCGLSNAAHKFLVIETFFDFILLDLFSAMNCDVNETRIEMKIMNDAEIASVVNKQSKINLISLRCTN